jgi:pyrimidine operon attenuation protein/uracil phosphoribosyltransferase
MQVPEAEQLIATLAEAMRPRVTADTCLVGIHTGGVWLAERLHALLGLPQPLGSIDVSFYRDDYSAKGLHPQPQGSKIPFDVEDAHIVIVDDVLYTGRTTRAALNELFDYGRPARVDLAVLIDRGGRELPVGASFCALTLPAPLPAGQNLQLERDASGALTMRLIHA